MRYLFILVCSLFLFNNSILGQNKKYRILTDTELSLINDLSSTFKDINKSIVISPLIRFSINLSSDEITVMINKYGFAKSQFKNTLKDKLLERESLSEQEAWSFELSPEVETDEAIVTRFIIKLREISIAYPGKTVLVVSHGGPIRMFLIKTGYASKKELPGGSFKNAGYIKVLSDGVDFFIKEVQGVQKPKGGE